MVIDIVSLLGGLLLLTVAGDVFVIGVARVAEALRMRPTVVGALVGGLGTSVPVLIVSAIATVQRAPEIALGNLVGSIIVNVSLGLAIASLVAPIKVDSQTVRREAPISVASVLFFAVVVHVGVTPVAAALSALALGGRSGRPVERRPPRRRRSAGARSHRVLRRSRSHTGEP